MSASSAVVGKPYPITATPIAFSDPDGVSRVVEGDALGHVKVASHGYVWDVDSLSWVPETQAGVISATRVSDYHKVAAASTNAAAIKATPGTVYGIKGFNLAAYPVYVKLYDKASAPNPAVDPVVRTIGMQAGLRCEDTLSTGLAFAVGIAVAIVKGISDTDTTAVLAADCVVDIDYV